MRGASTFQSSSLGAAVFVLLLLASGVAPLGTGGGGSSHGPAAGPSLPQGVAPATSLAPTVGRALPELPVAKTPSNTPIGSPQNGTSNAEVEQAFDASTGYLYESWICCNVGGIGFARSTDGGASFDPAVIVPGSAGYSWDPSVVVTSNGTVVVGYMNNNGSGDTPRVAWSFDHGVSFGGNRSVFPGNSSAFADREFLAAGPNGTLYMSWDYSPNGSLDRIGCARYGSCYFLSGDYNVVVAHSSDGGATWSAPVPVDPEYPWGGAISAPMLVQPDGTLDVLYEGYSTYGPNHTIGEGYNYFARSTDGGLSFSAPVAISSLPLLNTTWWIDGAITEDAAGTLYATFDSWNSTDGTDLPYLVASRDNGTSWSAPLALVTSNDSSAHIMVEAAGTGNGSAYVAWMSNNTTGEGWSVFEAVAYGAGTAVTSPVEVSSAVGNRTVWPGDTMGISDLTNGSVAVSWTYGSPTASGLLGEAFEATVPFPLPAATNLTARGGSANVTLSWTPVRSAPMDGYRVAWGVNGSLNEEENVSSLIRSVAIQNLTWNTTYSFVVTPYNEAGDGPSATANVTLSAWSVLEGSVVPATAEVRFDGSPVPTTSATFAINTTPGAHRLTASDYGYAPLLESLVLVWNATLDRNLSLIEEPATLEVAVTPTNASMSIESVPVALDAQGEAVVHELAGNYSIEASLTGFSPYFGNVSLAPSELKVVEIVLNALPAQSPPSNGSGSGAGGGNNSTNGGSPPLGSPPPPSPSSPASPLRTTLSIGAAVLAGAALLGALLFRRGGRKQTPAAPRGADVSPTDSRRVR